ncbi:DNA-directed RNA polymerase specialized sigma24 family protein [Actinoplanes lutulentus]|uniref:DNA-directed RNA polymerase specialized sigma24 family protein n=1 Tax=Actinoplanes lutulentus TaxID=1287878 RepID=A0A327ZAM1_9ACTN|nr:sigma factor [Actinoplanes lutulentus]MBB2946751.1 DNA-directed RNA polymerase specialized sigma24 family protein [Actinoplanes lutulentus]RAK35643.1 DNA-directed RNA polymerase specialized sigma24 family protein [Actinoplanes lutulentus]
MRDGAEEEYVEYVTARVPVLRRLAYVLTGDGHRADDLVQQTITTLYLKWPKARVADNIDAYVRTMLVRGYVDEKRLAWSKVRLFRQLPEPEPVEEVAAILGCSGGTVKSHTSRGLAALRRLLPPRIEVPR